MLSAASGIFPEICTSGLKNLSMGSSLGVSSELSKDVVIFEFSDPKRGSAACWSWDNTEGLVKASLMEAAAFSVLSVCKMSADFSLSSVGKLSAVVKKMVNKSLDGIIGENTVISHLFHICKLKYLSVKSSQFFILKVSSSSNSQSAYFSTFAILRADVCYFLCFTRKQRK